jgi:hypothetical protein
LSVIGPWKKAVFYYLSHYSPENKRFLFSALRESARGRDYADALQWLRDAGLTLRADAISHIELPLAGFVNDEIFKVYALDTGLLASEKTVKYLTYRFTR